MEKYDLTTPEGRKNVEKRLALIAPVPYFIYKMGKTLFSSDNTKVQAEAAGKLIKKGKEEGVDEMEIKVKNSKGFKLNVPYEGVQIDTIITPVRDNK